jgi:hypothetical protein
MRLSFAAGTALFLILVVVGYHASHRTMAYAATPTDKQPIVVELFTSEGCSSCPPADGVLRQLVHDQPVPGAEVLGLELHVDYWNYLGWVDPFSSEAFTARQRAYADALGQRGVYTPQLVVDGTKQCVGSDAATARALIAADAREPKATVRVSKSGDKVSIAVSDLPAKAEPADVWLAITEADLVTAVPRGENSGARLAHGPVVRVLRRVGTMATRDPLEIRDIAVDLKPEWRRDHLRAVAFVQPRASLRILGAAAIAMR